MSRLWPMLALCLSCACSVPRAAGLAQATALPDADVHSSADKGFISPKDSICFRIEIEHSPDVEMQVEEPGDAFGGMKRLEAHPGKVRRIDGRLKQTLEYKLCPEQEGAYELPGIRASYARPGAAKQWIRSPPVYVRVSSEPDPAPRALRDLKPIERIEYWNRMALGLGLAGAAVLLAVLYLLWRWRGGAPPPPAPPPHEVALEALERLQRLTPQEGHAMRQAAFAASEIIRIYVEARFALHAPYMTTEEIFGRLTSLSELQPEQRRRLKEFLEQTDRIKYAGMVPDGAQLQAVFERARRFVQVAVSPPTPSVPPPLPPAGSGTPSRGSR
jgi:hypothetical protein